MDTGMLWFDDGPQGLKDKVARAVSFYATKYGRTPTVCLVHPATTAGAEVGAVSGVVLRETHAILPNHFLVGIEDLAAGRAAEGKRGRKGSARGSEAQATRRKAA